MLNTLTRAALMAAIILGLAQGAGAAEAPANPYELVQNTTEAVLAKIKDARAYAQKDPQRFNQEVAQLLEPVVDFNSFARGVMGSYASGQRYKALASDQERSLFNQRIEHFSQSFKASLIAAYAGGLLNFNGQKIETLPARKGDDLASGAVVVTQTIVNASSAPYVIQYSMRRNASGQWKLNNITIEGVNLGLTYRSQFAALAEKYKGDLDQVIAAWSVVPEADIAPPKASPLATNNQPENSGPQPQEQRR